MIDYGIIARTRGGSVLGVFMTEDEAWDFCGDILRIGG